MATNTMTGRENLLNIAQMSHNQEIIDVAEVLNETNDMIADAHVQQANDITSHVVSRRARPCRGSAGDSVPVRETGLFLR